MSDDLKTALEEMGKRTLRLNEMLEDSSDTGMSELIAQLCAISFAQSNVIAKVCVMLDADRLRVTNPGA